MEINNVEAFIPYNAIIGMRFPHDSDSKSDSTRVIGSSTIIGEKDLELLCKLVARGRDHRKVIRMFSISLLAKMPLSWWMQYDTYKVGTVANSRSRMHTFGKRDLLMEDFVVPTSENEDEAFFLQQCYLDTIGAINNYLRIYRTEIKGDEQKARNAWIAALSLLPVGLLQERVLNFNYEVALEIIRARTGEKLSVEWNLFIAALRDNCPYLNELYNAANKERICS